MAKPPHDFPFLEPEGRGGRRLPGRDAHRSSSLVGLLLSNFKPTGIMKDEPNGVAA